jgi:hypothetical protein
MNEWERGRLGNIDPIEQFRIRQLIENALESVEEYIITDPLAEREGDFYPYFIGKTQSIEFVTTAPVFGKSLIAAAKIRLETAADHTHTLMVYEEAPFDQFYLRYFDEERPYSHSVVLSLAGKNLKFRYFGLLEYKYIVEENRIKAINSWQDNFDGSKKQTTPQRIKIVNFKDSKSPVIIYDIKAKNRFKLIYYELNL